MIIGYVSDVHLEFKQRFLKKSKRFSFNKPNADVLVLAGDIFVYRQYTESHEVKRLVNNFFDYCTNTYEHVVYVFGNHEFYSGEINNVRNEIKSLFPKVHVLDNDVVEINGVNFVGSTLWTDVNKNDHMTSFVLSKNLNDFKVIKNGDTNFKTQDCYNLHNKAFEFLSGEVNNECVVVTHHAPSILSVSELYMKSSHDLQINHGFYTNLEQFVMDNPKIKLWIHGHMHNESDYEIGETRVVCNPLGYYSDQIQIKTVQI
jgi:predicted phosphodiesterase